MTFGYCSQINKHQLPFGAEICSNIFRWTYLFRESEQIMSKRKYHQMYHRLKSNLESAKIFQYFITMENVL